MTYRELDKLLRKAGYELLYVRGSHHYYHSPITGKKFPVPRHSGDIKKGTLNKIFRQSGLK